VTVAASLLDPGDDAPRHAGGIGQVVLPPSLPATQGSKLTTEADGIHVRIIVRGAYLRLLSGDRVVVVRPRPDRQTSSLDHVGVA
jgi:hypothetical protein